MKTMQKKSTNHMMHNTLFLMESKNVKNYVQFYSHKKKMRIKLTNPFESYSRIHLKIH